MEGKLQGSMKRRKERKKKKHKNEEEEEQEEEEKNIDREMNNDREKIMLMIRNVSTNFCIFMLY